MAALVVPMSVAACSSSAAKKSAESSAEGTGRATVASAVCSSAASAKKVTPPAGFPKDFPFPKGTIVYSADDRGSSGIVITGVTSTAFAAVLSGLQRDLPKHGYTAKDGETEPDDAESDWTSASFQGRWAIRKIPQCPGDTLVNVVARTAG